MTPPAGATTTRTHRNGSGRRTATRPPRRVSGPAHGRRAAVPAAAAARGGAAVATPPLALRLGRRAARIGDARFLDRLVRGRAWIAIVAVGLLGIVFMQVSMLRLNAGISRAITTAETLHRQNSALRSEVSRLDSGERIRDAAGALGMFMAPGGSVNFLDARKADGRAAVRGIHPPKPGPKPAATTTTAAAATIAATAPEASTATPPAQATATTATQAPTATTTTQAPATTTQPLAQAQPQQTELQQTQPQPTQPQQTQPTQTQPTQTQAPPTAPIGSGGQ